MRAPLAVLAVSIGVASALHAQDRKCVGKSSLVYSDTVSFLLDAPTGWTLDCQAGKSDGPLTVLYRVGESWRTGEAVMYANVLTHEAKGPSAFKRRIDAEVADWKARVPDAVVTSDKGIRTRSGTTAAVRRFTSAAHGLHEIVAYIPRGSVTPVLAMTARTNAAFVLALPDFQRLVASYSPGPTVKRP